MPTYGTRLLLAEDDCVIRMDLHDALRRLGYQVVGDVGDGASAVALARELRPDLVIMCIRMPEMDGLTAARILRDERIAPVMLLSAMCDEELVARACEAGVVMYLTKPARDSDLLPAIEVALTRHREACEMERRVSILEDQLATRRLVERRWLKIDVWMSTSPPRCGTPRRDSCPGWPDRSATPS